MLANPDAREYKPVFASRVASAAAEDEPLPVVAAPVNAKLVALMAPDTPSVEAVLVRNRFEMSRHKLRFSIGTDMATPYELKYAESVLSLSTFVNACPVAVLRNRILNFDGGITLMVDINICEVATART